MNLVRSNLFILQENDPNIPNFETQIFPLSEFNDLDVIVKRISHQIKRKEYIFCVLIHFKRVKHPIKKSTFMFSSIPYHIIETIRENVLNKLPHWTFNANELIAIKSD